jgi:hypothetical protein
LVLTVEAPALIVGYADDAVYCDGEKGYKQPFAITLGSKSPPAALAGFG